MKKPKIIIADNNITFRQSLIFLINAEGCAEVIGKASTGFEIVELLAHLSPDLILMDIDIPQLNGIEIIENALTNQPDLKIIAFTMFNDDAYISRLIQLGVKGFILKSSAVRELENDIHYLLSDVNHRVNNQLINVINKMNPNRLNEQPITARIHTQTPIRLPISDVNTSFMYKTKKILSNISLMLQ